MKVWGTSMLRNEADIVEAFVRHNLAFLDGLVVVDHGSADATNDILLALCRERLPLVVLRNDSPGYLQPEIMTEAVRTTFARTGADYVMPLDADEFVKSPSREILRRALAALPAGMHGQIRWHNYVPDLRAAAPDIRAVLRGARRATPDLLKLRKVVVARVMLDRPVETISQGSHWVIPGRDAEALTRAAHAVLRSEALALAHVPIRGADQFLVKVAIKKLGRLATGVDWQPDATSQAAYEAIRDGAPVDADWLAGIAANWSLPRQRWLAAQDVTLVDDPFLADFPLRYTPPGAAAPLPLLLSAIERMARRLAEARAGAAGAARS